MQFNTLPDQNDIKILVKSICYETNKKFSYTSFQSPQVNFVRFLQGLTKINLMTLTHSFQCKKDIVVLTFNRKTNPYYIFTGYLYLLTFIQYDDSLNQIAIDII
jgi:hypothetical protein